MQLQILAELLGQLAGLVDPGGIGEGGGDAPLLPPALRQGQGSPQPQPPSRGRDLQADAGAQLPQRPVDAGQVGVPRGHAGVPDRVPTLARKGLFFAQAVPGWSLVWELLIARKPLTWLALGWWGSWGSNPPKADYESAAFTRLLDPLESSVRGLTTAARLGLDQRSSLAQLEPARLVVRQPFRSGVRSGRGLLCASSRKEVMLASAVPSYTIV